MPQHGPWEDFQQKGGEAGPWTDFQPSNFPRTPEPEEPPGFFRKAYEYTPLPLVPAAARAIWEDPLTLGGRPLRRRLVDEPQVEAGAKAIEAYRSGRPIEAVARGALAAVPLFGPMATSTIEDISGMAGRREYRGLAGAGAGLAATAGLSALAPKIAPPVAKAATRFAERPLVTKITPKTLRTPGGTAALEGSNLTTATRIMNSYADAPKKAYDFDINPGEEAARAVAEGKITAKTMPEAIDKFSTHADKVGQGIGETLRRADPTEDIPVAEQIQGPIVNALREARNQGPIESVQAWLAEHFPNPTMAPVDLWEGIKKIDRQTKFKEGTMEEMTANAVLQEVRGGLRRQLEARVPEIEMPSKSYAGLIRFTGALENQWRGLQSSPLPVGPGAPGSMLVSPSKPGVFAGGARYVYRHLRPLRGAIKKQDITPWIFKKVQSFTQELPARAEPIIQPWQKSLSLQGTGMTGPLLEGPTPRGGPSSMGPGADLLPPKFILPTNPAAMSPLEAPGYAGPKSVETITAEAAAQKAAQINKIEAELNRRRSIEGQRRKREAQAKIEAEARRKKRFE